MASPSLRPATADRNADVVMTNPGGTGNADWAILASAAPLDPVTAGSLASGSESDTTKSFMS